MGQLGLGHFLAQTTAAINQSFASSSTSISPPLITSIKAGANHSLALTDTGQVLSSTSFLTYFTDIFGIQ